MAQLPFLYNAFILNSSRAALILFLANAKKPPRLPPKIALALKAPVYGVVSQIDETDEAYIKRAELALINTGIKKIFRISSVSGEGLRELQDFLETQILPS
jgi:ethanolamine utilization protein EutP